MNEESQHLRLAGFQPLRVLQLLLIVVEETLDWRRVVGVLSGEDHLHAEVEQVPAHLPAAVVRRVVEQPVRVLPPVAALLGEQLGQAREEHQHDIAIGVELRQAEVQLALCVDGGDHIDAVAQRLIGDGVLLAPLPPLLVAKV